MPETLKAFVSFSTWRRPRKLPALAVMGNWAITDPLGPKGEQQINSEYVCVTHQPTGDIAMDVPRRKISH